MTTFDLTLVYLTVFGFGAVVIALLIRMLRRAARDLGSRERLWGNLLAIGLALWPVSAIVYSLTIGLSFDTLAPMLAVPWTIGLVLMFLPSVSRILATVPLHQLVGIGFYRVAGAIFLYCYYVPGTLTRGFALNAGWGDVLTGVLAIPVAWAVWKRAPFASLAIIVWSIIGIGDLILAPVSAAIYGAGQLEDFPINLIPLFLGPPFGILLHVVTLRAWWLQR